MKLKSNNNGNNGTRETSFASRSCNDYVIVDSQGNEFGAVTKMKNPNMPKAPASWFVVFPESWMHRARFSTLQEIRAELAKIETV